MKRIVRIALIVVLVGAGNRYRTTSIASAEDETKPSCDSPRLAALAKQLTGDEAGNRATIGKFLDDLSGKAPLVEAVEGDPHSRWITFLWRGGSDTHRVGVLGGPPSAEFGEQLQRLKNSNLWYRTDKVPSDSRFVYHFLINMPDKIPDDGPAAASFWKENPMRQDPLNRLASPSNHGSIAELPDAPLQPWLERVPGVPNYLSGWIEKAVTTRDIKESKVKSEILDEQRTYAVYTPPQYDFQKESCNLLVMFDGNGCRQPKNNPFPVNVILDNLISQKKIPPVVAVFVYQTEERSKELDCSEKFADFVSEELLTQVRKDYRITADPAKSIVSGMSLGGLMSSFCAYRHPDVFGNVLSLSGSYPWCPGMFEGMMTQASEPGWLTRQFVTSPRLPIHFYLTAGRFENFHPFSLLGENRRFRDVLKAKGYTVDYCEFSGGHDPVCWRGPFVEGLIALIGTPDVASQVNLSERQPTSQKP